MLRRKSNAEKLVGVAKVVIHGENTNTCQMLLLLRLLTFLYLISDQHLSREIVLNDANCSQLKN